MNMPHVSTGLNPKNDSKESNEDVILLKHLLPKSTINYGCMSVKTVLQKYLDFLHTNLQPVGVVNDPHNNPVTDDNSIIQAFIKETEQRLQKCNEFKQKDGCKTSCGMLANEFKVKSFSTAAEVAKSLGLQNQQEFFQQAATKEEISNSIVY